MAPAGSAHQATASKSVSRSMHRTRHTCHRHTCKRTCGAKTMPLRQTHSWLRQLRISRAKKKQIWKRRARGANKACICKTDKCERTMPHRVLTLTPASVCDVLSSQGLRDRSGGEELREKKPPLNVQTASLHSGSRSGKFQPAVNTVKINVSPLI